MGEIQDGLLHDNINKNNQERNMFGCEIWCDFFCACLWWCECWYNRASGIKLYFIQELKEQLGDLKDTNQSTVMDMIHAENVKQGRDKYKTLKVILMDTVFSKFTKIHACFLWFIRAAFFLPMA